ncbi:hypothetical protein Tco_0930814 [Tanacetum coccineum]
MRNRMCTYLRNICGYKHNQLKGKSYEEIQKLFDKTYKQVNSFVPMASDDKEKGSEKKAGGSRKKTLAKKRAGDEVADVLGLIIGWLRKFEAVRPKDMTDILWEITLLYFEQSKDDEVWKAQQDYTLISWRLFDSCGIHVLLMDTGIAIHMLVEKVLSALLKRTLLKEF